MTLANTPSPEILRRLLSYDPVTGVLTWRARTSAEMPLPGVRAVFNRRHAGKPAFTHRSNLGYSVGGVGGKRRFAHRVAWAIFYGEWPKGEIDHINGDPADNRIENLRVVSDGANQRNRAIRKDRAGETMGVCWNPPSNKWQASITARGKKRWLGLFANKSDAIVARKRAERELGYHPNHGRQPYHPHPEEGSQGR